MTFSGSKKFSCRSAIRRKHSVSMLMMLDEPMKPKYIVQGMSKVHVYRNSLNKRFYSKQNVLNVINSYHISISPIIIPKDLRNSLNRAFSLKKLNTFVTIRTRHVRDSREKLTSSYFDCLFFSKVFDQRRRILLNP